MGMVDHFLQDGDAVSCKGVEIGVIHTPGHTPGHLSFYFAPEAMLFAGDALAVVNGVFAAQNVRYAAEQISRLFQVRHHTPHEFSNDVA